MLKFKVLVFLNFLVITLGYSQNSVAPKLAFGITYSNITSQRPAYEDINPFRRGWWVTLEEDIKIKSIVSLDIGLTYQERIPLEYFEFQGNPMLGVAFFSSFVDYPSNPQNDFYNEGDFIRFPNFKYLHLETIPKVSFGKKLNISLGVGLFGGILLNRNNVTVTTSDFLLPKEFFESRGIDHDIEYNQFDFGWIPKVHFQYVVSERISMGLQYKSYHSLLRMNDSLVDTHIKVFNLFWVAYSGGITFQYKI